MELKKIALATALASMAGLYGCSNEGDVATVSIDAPVDNSDNSSTEIVNEGDNNTGADNGGVNLTTSSCPSWAERALTQVEVDGAAVNVCELPATILESRTLTNDTIWKMVGRVTVGNGNGQMSATAGTLENGDAVVDATLTIQAGTSVQAATGTFANLLITRGSSIDARGTADAPIVFSSDDAGYEGSGEWGGIIVHGYAQHNECFTAASTPATVCNVDAEGESGLAGGFDNTDSSGIMQYIVVTEGGFEFAPGDEINGISLVTVGNGTTFEYIQVDNNSDDGVEYYGGAVNSKYIVVTGAGDDSIDWDEGFQGNIQYLLVKQTENSGGNGIEADTEGSTFFDSAPFVMNATFVSVGNQVHRMKASTGGYIFNSVMTGGERCFRIGGAGTIANINDSLLYTNVIADCTALVLDEANGGKSTDGSEAAIAGLTLITGVPANLDGAYASQAAEASLAAAVDITAFAKDGDDIADLVDGKTADTDYLDATDYLGAVAPGTAAADAWFAGWTLEGSL